MFTYASMFTRSLTTGSFECRASEAIQSQQCQFILSVLIKKYYRIRGEHLNFTYKNKNFHITTKRCIQAQNYLEGRVFVL